MNILTFTISNETQIPAIGLGTWKLRRRKARNALQKALELGYRHIDTADAYSNHKEIGKTLTESNIPRKDLFITTKVWRTDLKENDVVEAGNRFLEELQTDYFDLLLIHWPNSSVTVEETLSGMQTLKKAGKVKAIGVSNFTIDHLKNALDTGVEITANQVEFHPSLNQKELQDFCDAKGIQIIAYSPIAQGQDLRLDIIKELAKKYDRTPAQIILNWHYQQGRVSIPRSKDPTHLEQNLKALEFELEKGDIQKIAQVKQNSRLIAPHFHEFFD